MLLFCCSLTVVEKTTQVAANVGVAAKQFFEPLPSVMKEKGWNGH